MKKYSFYILVVLSITTFFGFLIYYRVQTDTRITLVNEYGDINNLGDVELRLIKQLDQYRGLDIRLDKEGLKKQETAYITDYNDLTDKAYKELARGEKLSYASSDFLENDDFQAISLISNENDTLAYESNYTHKVIIKNKNNGKVVKNTLDNLGNNIDDSFNIQGSVIIHDKLYVLMTRIYNFQGEEENFIQMNSLNLLTFDSNTGELLEEKVISNEMDVSEAYCISENGNIYFLGGDITDDGYIGGTAFYKYNILQNQLEEVVVHSKGGSSEYFYHSNIREITEYEENIYLIDGDHNIMCLDKDYNIISQISLREVLKDYGDIYNDGNTEILIYEDKLYFNYIRDGMMEYNEKTDFRGIVVVISLKDKSVLYYGEVVAQGRNLDNFSWNPLVSRGFHIK